MKVEIVNLKVNSCVFFFLCVLPPAAPLSRGGSKKCTSNRQGRGFPWSKVGAANCVRGHCFLSNMGWRCQLGSGAVASRVQRPLWESQPEVFFLFLPLTTSHVYSEIDLTSLTMQDHTHAQHRHTKTHSRSETAWAEKRDSGSFGTFVSYYSMYCNCPLLSTWPDYTDKLKMLLSLVPLSRD